MSNEIEEMPTGMLKGTDKKQAIVKAPKKYLKLRKGRGFSPTEIKSAGIPLDDAKNLSLPIDTRRKSIHDENVKLLSTLYHEIVSMRQEKQIQLKVTNKAAFKELKELRSIKSNEAKLLIDAGVRSLRTLTEEEPASLADDTKIAVEKIEYWIEQAKVLDRRRSIMDSINELLQIKGMNKTYAKKLVDFGILSVEDLSQEKAEILAGDLKISEKIIEVWILDAMRQTGKPIPKIKKPTKKPEEKKPKVEKKKPDKKPDKKPEKKPKEEKKKPEKKPKEVKKKAEKKPKEAKKVIPTLKDLEGIGKGDLRSFKDLGITKLDELIKEDLEEISSITGINQMALQRWASEARDLLGIPQKKEKPKEVAKPTAKEPAKTSDPLSELLKLEGVGKKTAEKLVEAGIQSCDDLLDCDPKKLSKDSKISEKTLIKIIESLKNK